MKVSLKQHLNVSSRLYCQKISDKSILLLAHFKCLNTYAILSLLIALTCLTLFVTSIRPTNVEMRGMGGGKKHITLPLEEHSDMSGENSKAYILTGSFSSSLFSQHIVHIVPDNCVETFQINGVNVDLDTVIQGNTCDYQNGFDIDLKNYLKDGTNQFEIGLRDYGDWFGLSITHSSYDRPYVVLLLILMLEIAILLYFFLKNHLQLQKSIVIVMLLGLYVRIFYLSYTPYNVRMYDVGGHLDYIKYVANYWRLPDPEPSSGWENFQAPLYYITAAIVYKISNMLAFNYLVLLQLLSIIYSTIFLIFGVLILRIACKRKWLFFTSTALLVFWPSGIIHAVRVGNDVMYYMVCVITIYFLMRWLIDKQSTHFYLAALFAASTMATKLSGVLVLGIFGMFFVSTWLKTKQKRSYLLKIVFFINVVLVASYFSLFRGVITALQDPHFNMLVSNVSEQSSGLSVRNTLHNYVYFDVHTYITQAFTDSWNDIGGRQYFWNYCLKTMLFGEFSFPSAGGQFVATLLSILLLQMFNFLLFGLFANIVKLKHYNNVMILWFILSVLSLIYYRHSYPFSPSEDFRLIFPSIVPFIYFYMTGIDFFIEHKLRIVGIFGYILAFFFIIGSCLFFII